MVPILGPKGILLKESTDVIKMDLFLLKKSYLMETYLLFPIISSQISIPGIQLLLIENKNKKLILWLTYYGVDSDILNLFHTLTL